MAELIVRGDDGGLLRSEPKALVRLPIGLPLWLYLVVLWLTWAPVGDSPSGVEWLPDYSRTQLIGDLLLFAPLAFVLATYRAVTSRPAQAGRGNVVLWAAGVAALSSSIVELGQFQVVGRDVSPYDVALNTTGAAAAAWLAVRLIRGGIAGRELIMAAGTVVFVGVLVFVTATGFASSRSLILTDWYGYVVAAGDEPTGGRPYAGQVSDARVCAGPVEHEICADPGASPDTNLLLARAAAARDSQSVRLSALVYSNGAQIGDPRIVTFSADPGHRNASIEQSGRDVVLRLRTPVGGTNGTGLVFMLADAVRDSTSTRVSASYDQGQIVIGAEDRTRAVRAEFQLGFFSGWWLEKLSLAGQYRDRRVEAGELWRAVLVAAAAFSMPLGIAAAVISRGAPSLFRLVVGGSAAPLLLVLLGSALDVSVPLRELLAAGGFGVLGVGLGLVSWRPPRDSDRSPRPFLSR